MSPGFVKSINDSVAISFGVDLVKYDGSYRGYWGYYNYCYDAKNRPKCVGWNPDYYDGFWTLQVPVALQWNFWFTEHWSAFGEPGITIRHAFYSEPAWCDGSYSCTPTRTTVYPTFYAGGRFNFSDSLALTMRIGHPIDFSIGLSFFL